MSVAGALKRFILGGSDAAVSKNASLTKLLGMDAAKGLDDAALTAHHKHHADAMGSGLTPGSLTNIIEDVKGSVPVGIGGARATGEGNILTKAFNTTGGGNAAGALLMGGVIGGTAAGATDSNIGEGAVIGALVGGGVKAIGTGIAKDIEKKFVGDLLGDSAGKFTPVDPIKNMTRGDFYNTPLSALPKAADDLDIQKVFKQNKKLFKETGTIGELRASKGGDYEVDKIVAGAGVSMDDVIIPGQAGRSVRQQQLAAISSMDDAALKQAGSGAEFKKDFLMGKSKVNVGQATRMAGSIGSALTGMAFSSKQRDHRRGFNKRRGNRV